jgi:PAS domain S-box-containing protein
MASKPAYQELELQIQELETRIAESDAVEEKLKTSRELYQKMFDHAGLAIVVTDARTGKVVACNRKAHEELGYSREEYLSLSHADYILDSPESLLENTRNILKHGSWTYTSKLRTKTGEVLDFFRSAVVVKINRKTYLHGIRINITEQKKIEEALRQSEAKYRNILDNMDEGYYEVDLTGKFVFCHEASIRLFGIPPEEMVGKNFSNGMMNPDTEKKVSRLYNQVYRTGESGKRITYEITKRDGSVVTLETSVSLNRSPSGEIVGFRGVARDVTERVRLQEALKEREEFYRTLFEHAGVAMMLTDARTGYRIAYNRKAYEQLGYAEEEYKNISSQIFVASDQEFSELMKNLLEKGYYTNDLKLRRKNGEVGDFFRSAVKVKIVGKTYFHAIRFDVTDRKKAEKALKESEARFRSIFEIAPDPVFLWEVAGRKMIDANPAASRYSGYSREELLQLCMTDLVDPDILQEEQTVLEELMKSKACFYDSIHVRKNGDRVFVEISSRILEPAGGEIVLSMVRDVTARKKAEEELARYRLHLEDLVRERTEKLAATESELIKQEKMAVLGQLTATVSHELRNPLGVIHSSRDYLQKRIKNPDEKTQKHLSRIEDQVRICDTIVSDLLEYTSSSRLNRVPGNLVLWMEPLLDRIFEGEKIRLERDYATDLPELDHDRIKLQQVVINVLDNAIQAVKAKVDASSREKKVYEPEIHVTLRVESGNMILKISDNGVGMDGKTLGQAFEPLFTTRARGTGLGLANAKKIVREHGGDITLASEPGRGTAVAIQLPCGR